jgi:hypothetical protein
MLLGTFGSLRRAEQKAVLETVEGHPASKTADTPGILLRVATLLKHLQPDAATAHPLEPRQILEGHREIPSPFGILRGKPATDEDGGEGGSHGSVEKRIIWNSGTQEWKESQKGDDVF